MKSAFFFVLFVVLCSCIATDVPTLPELVTSSGKFDILVQLLSTTNLLSTVVEAKGITIFAPTDDSFAFTAKELGCKDTSTDSSVISCLADLLTVEQISTVLQYHVVPGVFNSNMVVTRRSFRTLNGKTILRSRTTLIDLTAGVRNPKLVVSMLDLKYNNGIVHTIDGVLLPFVNLLADRPCNQFENTIALADEKFMSLFVLFRTARYCRSARTAIQHCRTENVCRSFVGQLHVASGLSLGKTVAAALTCNSAAEAIRNCGIH